MFVLSCYSLFVQITGLNFNFLFTHCSNVGCGGPEEKETYKFYCAGALGHSLDKIGDVN